MTGMNTSPASSFALTPHASAHGEDTCRGCCSYSMYSILRRSTVREGEEEEWWPHDGQWTALDGGWY